jgi:CRISPR/Cas system CMR subunit Cmr6 (Cas7 group RAMP superfamily)
MLDSVLAFAALAIVLSQDLIAPHQSAAPRKGAQPKDSMQPKPVVNRVKVW